MCHIGLRIKRIIGHHFAPLNGLKESVVDIARNPSAFCQAFVEAGVHNRRDLPTSKPIARHEDGESRTQAKQTKPQLLIVGGFDYEVQRRTGFVPHAVVVAGDNVETIMPRRKVAVESLPPCTWFLPAGVTPFQFVAKSDLLRNYKAKGGVVDFKVPCSRRQADVFGRRVSNLIWPLLML